MLSNTSTSRSGRLQAFAFVIVGLGIAAGSGNAIGQNLVDPYQPFSSSYSSSSFPTLPNNLALPGQAREAGEYNRSSTSSRYNTFDRYRDDGDEFQTGGSRRGSGIGVPYYQSARPASKTFQREYAPAVEADRKFYAYEVERDRRYAEAMKEKDPTKRAKLLREVARMQMPRGGVNRTSDPRRLPAPRSNPSASSTTPPSTTEPLAPGARAGTRPAVSGTSPTTAAPGARPPSTGGRRQGPSPLPSRRPPMPSETPEAGRQQAPR